ncbi:MAG: hypothetical protein AAB729_00780 [Patescibacteria group bacterium]
MSIEHPRFEYEHPKDFIIFSKDILERIQSAVRNGEDVSIGPEFIVTGGSPGDIKVDTVIHNLNAELDKSTLYRNYYLFEKSAEFGLVGIRAVSFIIYSDQTGVVNSDVNISRRGKGYLRPLETVTVFVIQNEANRINGDLEWEITNDNLEELEKIEIRQGLQSPQAIAKKAEQERWRKFYSEENLGIVSTDKNYAYERVFQKKGDYVDTEKVTQITGPVLEKGEVNFHPTDSTNKTFTLDDVIADLERVK